VSEPTRQWICCQIGNREHYAVPRAFNRSGRLRLLITDAWLPPSPLEAVAPARLRGRYHRELGAAPVWAPTAGALAFEAKRRMARRHGWQPVIERNTWFQERVIAHLDQAIASSEDRPSTVLFAYSYAAGRIFEYAKRRHWTTVLGQIDAGPPEESLVGQLQHRHSDLAPDWEPAPAIYWQRWRQEWQHADRMIVNSEWARRAMIEEGVRGDLLRVVPLGFESCAASSVRSFAARFTDARPLRMLFLGQAGLRKGIAELLDAVELLHAHPVHLSIVGPVQIKIPERFRNHPRITWVGSVAPAKAATYYAANDVFLFPTHSDGFGITQLEAQAHALPVIATRFCGDVVTDGVNGVVLADVSARSIAGAIERLLAAPEAIAAMSRRSYVAERFGVAATGAALSQSVD
jgi:glycosyltransferase involved in cell wall biosynthesis